MHWKGLHAIRWGLNSKVGVDSLSGSMISLRSAMEEVLEDVRCAGGLSIVLDVALGNASVLDAVGALDLESATGGSLGIATGGSLRVAIGGIRDHWIRDCFRSRSFSRGCFRIYNFTHFFRSSLERTKGNRRASVLGFGVVEGDGITLV